MTNKVISFRPSDALLEALQTTANKHHIEKINGDVIDNLWRDLENEIFEFKQELELRDESLRKIAEVNDSLKRAMDDRTLQIQDQQRDKTQCAVTGVFVYTKICEGCKRHSGIYPMCPLKLESKPTEQVLQSNTGGIMTH